MGFASQTSEKEQILIANIWKLVGGNYAGDGKVLLWNAKAIMCCIQNFHIDWLIDLNRQEDHPAKQFGRFEEGKLYLSPNEILTLTKRFNIMYKNRQNSLTGSLSKTHKHNADVKGTGGENFKFRPKVSTKNQKLA